MEQSRGRILAAADAERRRVERDLHDGAQQRLVAMALHLKLATRGQPDDPVLAELAVQVQQAMAELRELARGIHPAALEEGLGPALETVTARLPVPVELVIPDVRLPPVIELTGYYIVCEAITNAIKHADARIISVAAAHDGGRFTLTIRDDGVGGAGTDNGSGLAGLLDRVDAVGGHLQITSPVGVGTMISASLPCGC